MSAEQELDRAIPREKVLAAVRQFLDAAGWELEFGEPARVLRIPREPAPLLVSRAYVKAEAPGVFMGDHYEAVVALGPDVGAEYGVFATRGRLKLYFNLDGDLVSEDRFPPPA